MTTGGEERRRFFLGALLGEVALGPVEEIGGPFDTIYLGGGTPSILEAGDLDRLLSAAREHLPIAEPVRISLEANPEDVDVERLSAWRRLGVTTLSLGVQSFDDGTLRYLGRRHDGGQAREAVTAALGAGFETVSVDLIYGLPNREAADWERDLQSAAKLAPDHISCYQLTVHEGTPFGRRQARGETIELPEEMQARLFRMTHEILGEAGYEGYEVSNFARAPRHRSSHNTKYWDHTPYLGLGPSAHSFDGRRRWWNERTVEPWGRLVEQGVRPVAGAEDLQPRDLLLERLMLALRTRAGLDLREIESRYGVNLHSNRGPGIERLVANGLLVSEGARLRPTLDGLAVADSLAVALGGIDE